MKFTQHQVMDKAKKFNFSNISIVENINDPLLVIIDAKCSKFQKWKKRKYIRFGKWLSNVKPVGIMVVYNGMSI